MIAIVAVGQIFVILTGGVDLSVGSVVALNACVAVMLANANYSSILVFFVPVIIGLLIGLFNGFLINEVKITPFIVTLAMLVTVRGLNYVITSGLIVVLTPEAIERFSIYGKGFVGPIPVPVIIMGIIFCIGYFILYRTKLGQYVYAVGDNEETTKLAGINIKMTKYFVYGICGMLAGLAGVIYGSRLSYGTPVLAGSFNFDSIIPVVMGGAVLSGGKGSLTNTIVSVIILGVLKSSMNMLNVSPFIQDGVRGVILLLAIYFMSGQRKK